MGIPLIAVLLGAALLLFAGTAARGLKPLMQYVFLSPKPVEEERDEEKITTNRPLTEVVNRFLALREELSEISSASALSAEAPGTSFINGEKLKQDGTLLAVSEAYFRVYPQLLVAGRLPDEEELKWGERVAVLSEQLAYKLYRTLDPVGQTLSIGGVNYRIIGVVRQQSRIGRRDQNYGYIPLTQAARGETAFETATASILPLQGAGAGSAFAELIKGLGTGDVIDVMKERMRALLPLRLLLCAAGGLLIGWALRAWSLRTRRSVEGIRYRLQSEYLARLWPRAVILTLQCLAGYLVILVAAFCVLTYFIEPVYTFAEWIPKILVERTEIAKTFWALQEAAAQTLSFRSPELLYARFIASVTLAGCGCVLLGGLYGIIRARLTR